MHCADPLFSKNSIDLGLFVPKIVSGRFLFFFKVNSAPNLLKGFEILVKSLFERLVSPINLIGFGVLIKKPKINLPKVPEFFASIQIFFLYL